MSAESKAPIAEDFFWDTGLRLGADTQALTKATWPRFLIEASDVPDATLQFQVAGEVLFKNFPCWGIRPIQDQKLVAFANGLLIQAPIAEAALPERGWQFAMEAFASGESPNCLCLLSANVHPDFQNLGLSRLLLEKAKEVTAQAGFATMIGPVRPSHKHLFHELSFDDYIQKKTATGQIFNPWLRSHVRSGAQILNVCRESAVVRATVAKWEDWLARKFTGSGKFEFTNGLAPVEINLSHDIGVYCEPNVWAKYTV